MVDYLDDESDFEEQLEKMDVNISNNKHRQYTKHQKQVNKDLLPCHLQPNNAQFGCAVAALCDKKQPRSIISVPSGKGKSRVIASIVALAAYQDSVKDFTIVYSSDLLKSVDSLAY